jgi:two-component system CheB/CheR fusion protein
MASTQIATVFLDQNLKIKRFTPSITKVIPLLHSDIGRPIGHFASTLLYKGWVKDIKKVLETLVYLEKEVQTVDKIWYNLRIMPYRTLENVIEGVVVTFFDISKQKLNEESLKRVHEHLNLIMHALPCIPYTATLKEHELTFVGSSAKAITGYDRNAFDDNKTFWMDNIHPEDKKLVMTALNKIKTDGYSSHKFRWKCSDGAYRRFINFVRKVRFFHTEPEILVGFWQDVSANQTST